VPANVFATCQPPRGIAGGVAALAVILSLAAPGILALAQTASPAGAVSLEQAIALAVTGPALEIARIQLAGAKLDFERAMADNLLSGSPLAEQMARNELRRAEHDFRESHFQAVSSVVGAYLGVLTASNGVRVAELQQRIAEAALDAAQEKARAGMLGPLDLEDARHAARTAQQDLAEARISLEEAVGQLAAALGYPETMPSVDALQLPQDLPRLPVLDTDEAVAAALTRSDLMTWHDEAVDIARKQLQQAQAEQAPAMDVTAREQAVQSAELQRRQARLDLERSVRSALARAATAARRLELAEAAVRLEQQRLDAVRQQQQAGLKTAQAVMQAEVAALQAHRGYLTAVQEYLTRLVELRRLLGEEPGLGPSTAEAMGVATGEAGSTR